MWIRVFPFFFFLHVFVVLCCVFCCSRTHVSRKTTLLLKTRRVMFCSATPRCVIHFLAHRCVVGVLTLPPPPPFWPPKCFLCFCKYGTLPSWFCRCSLAAPWTLPGVYAVLRERAEPAIFLLPSEGHATPLRRGCPGTAGLPRGPFCCRSAVFWRLLWGRSVLFVRTCSLR